jgi:hypothetical protein
MIRLKNEIGQDLKKRAADAIVSAVDIENLTIKLSAINEVEGLDTPEIRAMLTKSKTSSDPLIAKRSATLLNILLKSDSSTGKGELKSGGKILPNGLPSPVEEKNYLPDEPTSDRNAHLSNPSPENGSRSPRSRKWIYSGIGLALLALGFFIGRQLRTGRAGHDFGRHER